jgi:preprotein translocase subunit YajC
MDGLNLKFARSPLEGYFTFDEHGALIPIRDSLRMEQVASRLSRQLKANTGLYRRLTDTYYRTDVEFTDNPVGNTPAIGWGKKRYGPRPVTGDFREKKTYGTKRTPQIVKALEKREAKIVEDQKKYMSLYSSLEPTDKESSEYVQYLVEGDQVMTGGGFDGNSIGEVQKSALKFVIKGNENVEFGNNRFSQLCVEGALWLRDELEKAGLRRGSLSPVGCSAVRMEQDNDGMIGFPVYSKGWSELNSDIATRLLIDSGVDTRHLVGSQVTDPRTGELGKAKVVDAIAYVLDHTVISDPSDAPSIVTLLARIQKHGWKEEDGQIVPKKSKTRSVYPNAARAGMIEAMVGTPLIKELQNIKCPFMPSLLDKPQRVEIIKTLITKGHAENYEFLSLDESQYDATVIGGALATMMYYAIRPFYNAKYYDWVDFAIQCLVFKYLITDTALDSVNEEEFSEAKKSGAWVEVKPFTIFGMTDGLISGAKLTHVGGSFYGGVVIHYVMPKLMGFQPLLGVQAGDDCVWAYPRDRVDYSSMEKTYGPVEDTAKIVGIDINKTKQIWHVVSGELVNIFLQDVYHEASGTWGTGSIFRPLTAVFFSERDKGLSIAEQFMAEIARMNQGSDSAFAAAGVKCWLEMEQFIGSLFKEYGVSAFQVIVESIGTSVEEIAKRIDVGSFTFGVSQKDMKEGTLPILPIIAEVSKDMSFERSAAQALKALDVERGGVQADETEGLIENEADIGDSDDVLAN